MNPADLSQAENQASYPPFEESLMLKCLVGATIVVLCCVSSTLGDEVVKITVRSSGSVLLDGRPITLPDLERRFKALKAADGTVWYHRENATRGGPPEASAVVRLIIKYKLPIRLSTKPDFSDYVDERGVSHPGR
jgi:hypothetical protein